MEDRDFRLDMLTHFWDGSGLADKFDLLLAHYDEKQARRVLKEIGPALKIKKKSGVEYICLNTKKDFKPEHKIECLQDQLEAYREESNRVYQVARELCSALGL